MRVGAAIFVQNSPDWGRFLAEERGEPVAIRPARSDQEIVLEDIEFAKLADKLGFDSIWAPEHHVTPYTMVPHPLQLFTYLAGVTERVDFGSMVMVLPWHNPVRLAEEIVFLDNILGERSFTVGVGRGIGRREYDALGVDVDESLGRYEECLQILSLALTEPTFSFKGEYFDLTDVRLRPQVLPGQFDPSQIYAAATTPPSLEIVARLGMKQLIVPQANWKKVRKLYDVFQHMRAKNGHARSDSKVGVWIHCAATEEEARANAEWHGLDYMRGAIEHYELTGQQWDNVRGFETYANNAKLFREDESARNELLRQMIDYNIWGTPDQCIEKLIEISHMLDVSELMFVMKYGSMSFEVAEASMRLLAQEVLPVIKELEVQATQVPDPAAELEQLTASGAQ